MGNLIFALAITLLLHDSSGQKWRVSKDKDKNLKSIEMVLETDVNQLQSNGSHMNRLVINSTYDDSISISASIEKGVNVTVRQDRRGIIDVANKPTTKKSKSEEHSLDRMKKIAMKLIVDSNLPIKVNIKRTKALLNTLNKLKSRKVDKETNRKFQDLEKKLRAHLINLFSRVNDIRLEYATSILDRNLNGTDWNQSKLKTLDKLATFSNAMAIKTKNVKLQSLSLKTVGDYRNRTKALKDTQNIKAAITKIHNALQTEYFTLRTVETLSSYIDELNQLQQTLTSSEQVEGVKQLKRKIEEVMEAVNSLATATQITRLDQDQFAKAVSNATGLTDTLQSIAKSKLNIKYKMRAKYLYRKLERKIKVSEEKHERGVKISNQQNRTEALFKNVKEVLQMSSQEFPNAVQSVPALKASLEEILASDLGKSYRDEAEQLLKDLQSKWASYEEALEKNSKVTAMKTRAEDVFARAKKILQLDRAEFMQQKSVITEMMKSLRDVVKTKKFAVLAKRFAFLIMTRVRAESALTKVLKVFDRAEEMLKMTEREFDKVAEEFANIKKKLMLVSESELPKIYVEKAKTLLKEIDEKAPKASLASGVKEKRKWLGILNAINQTLTNPNGFGGKVGLRLMRNKLNRTLKTVPDADVGTKATLLLKSVEDHETKIEEVLKLLQHVESSTKPIERDEELSEYERILNKLKEVMRKVNDPEVSRKSSELITRIQKFIEDYKVKMQINGITTVISKMNNSLEQAEREDEAKHKQIVMIQQGPHDFRANFVPSAQRSLPRKQRKPANKEEALELLKILNGYLSIVMPDIQNQIKNISRDFQKVNNSQLGTSGMQDRVAIAMKDYNRIKSGLENVAGKLNVFKFSEEELRASTDITNANATSAKLFKLESLIDDDYTHDLVKKTFKLTQDVEHANDILKQLRQMIVFNEKLLMPVAVTDKAIKHIIVPIQRPSLNSSLATDDGKGKAADKAVDLVTAAAEPGSG